MWYKNLFQDASMIEGQISGDIRWHVFIVDDNVADRRLMEIALQQLDNVGSISQYSSPDVVNTIEKLHSESIHNHFFVFLDLHLTPFDGAKILRQLRAQFPPTRVPVVTISGQSDESSWAQAYDSGANAFWEKPMDLDQLFEQTKSIIRLFSQLWGSEQALLHKANG